MQSNDDQVCSTARRDDVSAWTAVERLVARSADQGVVSRPARERVAAAVAVQQVVLRTSGERIGSREQGVIQGGVVVVCSPGRQGGGWDGEAGEVELDHALEFILDGDDRSAGQQALAVEGQV